jgi:uncharacterized membrane protein YraQ (UPF0718 family)
MDWFQFHFEDFTISFLSLILESVPFLLLGSMISGFVEVFVPASTFEHLLPRRRAPAVLFAGLLPIFLPMCECGVVPVIRRLMRKGLPPAYAVTYLLAAPIVNPVVALSTLGAFSGGEFFSQRESNPVFAETPAMIIVMWRMLLGYIVAVACGFLALAFKPQSYLQPGILQPDAPPIRTGLTRIARGGEGVAAVSLWRRVMHAFGFAGTDFVEIASFLVIGCALTAIFNTAVDQDIILPLAFEPWRAIAVMLALAFALALCSTSDAFIAATFVTFPTSAVMGFMVFGPVFDIKLVFLYSLVFRRRVVAGFGVGLFIFLMVICHRLLPYLQ